MLMNGFGYDMVKTFLKTGKFEAVTEYAKIMHPKRKKKVIVSSYKGSNIRVYSRDDQIHLLYPEDVPEIQMESVADAITKGTIFDDAESIDNHASMLTMANSPMNALTHHGIDTPQHLKIVISGIIGKMSDDGTLEISLTDINNGQQFMNQLHELDHCDSEEVNKLTDHYLDTKDHYSLPNDLKDDIADSVDEIKDINKHKDEEPVDDDDFEDDEDDKDKDKKDDETYEEGFFSRRPKKLKPIPRDVVAYITVEMNAIKDSNDQAMLAGYTCSKLELVDFYLNCLDTNDERYSVPHTKQYLVQMQTDLNNLLNQILKLKPINRSQGIWKQNVTLPEGWR